MQLRYVFSELGQGLRRNVSMHIAVVLTLFVSMTLVGLGVLLNQQRSLATEYLGNQLEIATYLCRDSDVNPSCASAATEAQKQAIVDVIEASPEVESYRFETKEEAFEKVKKLLGDGAVRRPNPVMTADDMSEAYWITLKDPKRVRGDHQRGGRARRGLQHPRRAGHGQTAVRLPRHVEVRLVGGGRVPARSPRCCWSPTRSGWRRSRGARRSASCAWSGASTLYIALPFLLEALVTAVIGVALAAGALGAVMWFGVEQRISRRCRSCRGSGCPTSPPR